MNHGYDARRTQKTCLFGVWFTMLTFCSATHSASPGAPQAILIDDTPTSGKVYLVRVDEDVSVVDLWGGAQARWIITNRFGRLAYGLHGRPNATVSQLDGLERMTESVPIDSAKLPPIPEGDISPDGAKLCFRSVVDGEYVVQVLDLATGNVDVVTSADGPISPPVWSPDGESIAYYVGTPESPVHDDFSVAISRQSGKNWRRTVVAPPSKLSRRGLKRRDAPPIWGPRGMTLVFEARYRDEERGPQWYTVTKTGDGLTWIGDIYSTPSCFPGHSGTVFTRRDEGVFLLESQTGKVSECFANKDAYFPKLSPDGKLIAYSNDDGVLFVANSDGSDARIIRDMRTNVMYGRFRWVSVGVLDRK